MAAIQDMLAIKDVLLTSAKGATGKMLYEGLCHALQDIPEERHELQVAVLKMVEQVLSAAQSSARVEAEQTCQQKVDAAEAELQVRKASVTTATEELKSICIAAVAQKAKLEICQRQLVSEEEEHTRAEIADEYKATKVAVHEQGKQEVAQLLETIAQQGSSEAAVKYLRSINAEPTLVAAVRSVLEKEPAQRNGFDSVAMEHLQTLLEMKVAEWQASVEVTLAAKASVHAEALGAWAIKEVAGDNVRMAEQAAAEGEAAVAAAQQKLDEAKELEQHDEAVLAHYLTDLALAGARVNQCSTALESLARLEAGTEPEPTEVAAVEMDVDDEALAAKLDAVLDVDMGQLIAA